MKLNLKWKCLAAVGCMALAVGLPGFAQAAAKKPNILVIWGDDVGYWNVSHNNRGMRWDIKHQTLIVSPVKD